MSSLGPDLPEVVYHYTSVSNLLNIVQSGELWATHIGYMNDVSERRLVLDAVPEARDSFWKYFGFDYTRLAELARIELEERELDELPFVVSFTGHRNSLTQWRSYCPNGNGVSIGFRTSRLSRQLFPDNLTGFTPETDFQQVTYLNRCDQDRVKRFLRNAVQAFDGCSSDSLGLSKEELLIMRLQALASFVKHESFASEEEYRLLISRINVRIYSDLLGVRASKTTLIPYVKVPLSESANDSEDSFPISEIVVGPCPNPQLSVRALQLWSQLQGLNVTVSESDLPYRDV